MNFFVYNIYTGEILRMGNCSEDMISLQAQSGETVIEGTANDHTQYIIDGVVTDFTPEELALKNNPPYGYKWKMPERIIVKVSDEEFAMLEKARISTLWNAANKTESETIIGSGVGLLAIGCMSGLPKAFAVKNYLQQLWDEYYVRKDSGSNDTDFKKTVGECPYTVVELANEIGDKMKGK